MADRNVFRREVSWDRGRPEVASPQRPPWLLPGVVAGVVFLIIALAVGSRMGSDDNPELEAQLSVLEREVQALKATPTPEPTREPCQDGTAHLAIVSAQELSAEWQQAYASARSALQIEDLCRENRSELARKAVANGLNANWATPAEPASPNVQENAVDRYRQIEQLASNYALSFPLSARQGAEQAYEASQFELAIVLVEQAAGRGEIAASDPLQARFAAAAYYNQGYHYALDGADKATRDEGLRFLLSAHLIDREHQLGISEAWRLLSQLIGNDERLWTRRIEPLPSAFLSSSESKPEAAAPPARLR